METWPPAPTNEQLKPITITTNPDKLRMIGSMALGCSMVALAILVTQLTVSEIAVTVTKMLLNIESGLLYHFSQLMAGVGFVLGIVSRSTWTGRIALLCPICFFLLPFVCLMLHWYGVLPYH